MAANLSSLSFDWRKTIVVPKWDCGFIRWSSQHYIPPEWFVRQVKDFDLLIITGGRGKFRHPKGDIIPLKRGVVIYLRPHDIGEAWQEVGKEQVTMFWFHHDLLQKGRRLTAQSFAQVPFWYESNEVGFYEIVSRKIHRLMRPTSHRTPDMEAFQTQQAATLLRSLLMEFDCSARLPRHPDHSEVEQFHVNLVNDLLARIHLHPEVYSNASILARYSGYSPDYLARIFKKVMNITPTEAIIEARLQRAKELLLTSQRSISEIADLCGYQNAFYFSNQFKKKLGVSPLKFRIKS